MKLCDEAVTVFISALNSTFVSMPLRFTPLAGSMPRVWEWKEMISDCMLKLTARSNLPAFFLCASAMCLCMCTLSSCIQPEWPRWIQENGFGEHPVATKFL